MNFRRRRPSPKKKASTLIITLLVVVILSTIVVAFMQSMSIERITARSYANQLRAENAAYSGLNYLIAQVEPLVTNYTYNVVSVTTNGQDYLFLGSPVGGTNTNVVYSPLFSGGDTVTNAITKLPTVNIGTNFVIATNRPRVSSYMTVPRVGWIDIPLTNAGMLQKLRFCYTVSDLEGGLNLATAGNTNGAAGQHSRATNTNASALGLFTLFSPTSQVDSGTTAARTLLQNRKSILTGDSFYQFNSTNTNARASLSANMGVYVERDTIPKGFGYKDEGKTKYAINVLVGSGGASAVTAISDVIKENMTNFESSRKGGFNRGSYLKTIAANVVDYLDADSSSTAAADYRGVDSYPFVNLIYSRYAWTAGTGVTGNPVTIVARTFVDLWNPSSKTAIGTVDLEFKNSNGVTMGGAQNFGSEVFPAFSATIPPNGHTVIEAGSRTYTFINGSGITGVSAPLYWKDMSANFDTTFALKWNGTLVDEFRGGARRPGSNNGSSLDSGDTKRKYQGNAVALDYNSGQVGDPRSSYYISTYVFDRNYDGNTAWGGRQFAGGMADQPDGLHPFKEVKFTRWPDQGNDGPNFPATTGISTATSQAPQYGLESPPKSGNVAQNGRGTWIGFADGTIPTAIPRPPNFSGLAPSIIANSGTMTNICELGNIFDPAQWNGIASGTSASSAIAGGGFSLRIGQAEFPRFNTNGARAAQLLDLFTIQTNRTNSGAINLNTATRDALRAVVAGLNLQVSSNLQPTNTAFYPARSAAGYAGDRFADAVIASRPFLSVAQLSYATNSLGTYFGNTNQWGTLSEAPSMWNDVAREQFFSDILPLINVRSRNLRVFVCGQVLDNRGKILGNANFVFNVFLEPIDDGSSVKIKPRILYVQRF
jgi:Tfp pilus assembly protein PilX